jgi:site-specific recombinase XerD
MEVEEALDRYVVQLEADGRSRHTIGQVTRHVRLLAKWIGAVEIEDVRHEDIAKFLASEVVTKRADGGPRKPTSSNAVRSSLRTFLAFVHAAGYMKMNPGRLIRRSRCPPPRPRALPVADCERLLATLDTAKSHSELRDRALFGTILGVGLRVGSAVHLEVRDVDLDAAELRLRKMKNGDEDVVFLPPRIVALLREYIGERTAGPLFPASHGGRMAARSVHRRLEWWAERAGIQRQVSPHALRHSFALAIYGATHDVLVVGRALCHRSVASTAVYARPSDAAVRAAVAG